MPFPGITEVVCRVTTPAGMHDAARASCMLADAVNRVSDVQRMTAAVSGCSAPVAARGPSGASSGLGKSRFRSTPLLRARCGRCSAVVQLIVNVLSYAKTQAVWLQVPTRSSSALQQDHGLVGVAVASM